MPESANMENAILLEKLRNLSQSIPDNDLNALKEWKDICIEFNQLQATKDNKIPQSEFEQKWSVFYNKENVGTFTAGSKTAEAWRELSEEFLRRIDRYTPIYIVDDNDPNKILKILPPLFREIDTLNTPSIEHSGKPIAKDEEGNVIDTSYMAGIVNNVFDKLGNHQLRSKREEGAAILNKCLMYVQNEQRILDDVKRTDIILENFAREKQSDTDTTGTTSEDFGITYE